MVWGPLLILLVHVCLSSAFCDIRSRDVIQLETSGCEQSEVCFSNVPLNTTRTPEVMRQQHYLRSGSDAV